MIGVTADLNPIDAVAKAQTLIERGPLGFVAALFAVAFIVALWMLIKSKDRHLLAQETTARQHAESVAQLQSEHAEKLDRLRELERERSIKLEILLHGLLEVTDDIRYLAFKSRERDGRARQPKSGEQKLPGDGKGP